MKKYQYINLMVLMLFFSNCRHPRIFSEDKILSCYKKKYFDEVVNTTEYQEIYKEVNNFVEEWYKTIGRKSFKKRYPIGSYQKYTLKVDTNILFNKDKTRCIIPILYQMEDKISSDKIKHIIGKYANSKWSFVFKGGTLVIWRDQKKVKSFDEISRIALLSLLDDGYMDHIFCRVDYHYIDNHPWFDAK